MQEEKSTRKGELFIVDNSDTEWKVQKYLSEWCDISTSFDIATGNFEIGSLLSLDQKWQNLEKIRILMGDEVTKRTQKALLLGVAKQRLDSSIEETKENNDFLSGVPAIVEALRNKQIECKVYNKEKFHAKAYITHAKQAVVGSSALVGSSNFTLPGLLKNVELNIQLRREVEILQEWFERYWNEAEDVSEEILRVIERHTREYSPFEVYAKALQEFFRGHEMTPGEWEECESRMYHVLDQYQKEGYQSMMKIAHRYGGAFLCDGVGLGKTFVGLMLIERLVEFDRKRVVLLVPKAARKDVWERDLKRYLPHISRVFSTLVIYNHTDLSRGEDFQKKFNDVKDMADAIIIDEAHHFRNPGVSGEGRGRPSRYRRLFDIAEGKTIFMLTATPVNNRLIDLQHMIELFSRRKDDYFKEAPLGIHSLRGHFIRMEKELEALVLGKEHEDVQMKLDLNTNQAEAEQVLFSSKLFENLVIQRSRAYVKESQEQHGGRKVLFPERQPPKVVPYSLKKTYGELLSMIEKAFSGKKPLFSLAIYYPLAYYKGPNADIDPLEEGRQKQVVGLIRTLFLKRFESSAHSFEMSCIELLMKLLAWTERHSQTESEKKILKRWKDQHEDLLRHTESRRRELLGGDMEEEEDEDDVVTEEMLDAVEELKREEYKVEEILSETYLDLDQTVMFLTELKRFKPSHDDKLQTLVGLLKSDNLLKEHKVLIFTEYMATARYLKKELGNAGIKGLDEVDSSDKRNRSDVIAQFAPYYNDSSSAELETKKLKDTRVMISTDVLSEGLNLQDATLLINYDIHWNPVRLMQRIGRLDRRINQEIEDKMLADHPKLSEIRRPVPKIHYWNFLPPDELNTLLHLYNIVAHKTLRISKTFGIEGKKLLTPEDEYEALRDFIHQYEGTTKPLEKMHLEYQKILEQNPDLERRLKELPGRVFSGKEHPKAGAKGVFFCYSLPAPESRTEGRKESKEIQWTEAAGFTGWYLYDLNRERILEEPTEIIDLIRCNPETPRYRQTPDKTLSEIRIVVEKHIKNTYLKKVQAPIGIKPVLKAWMELS